MEVATTSLENGCPVVIADTITVLGAAHAGAVIVCASHGGASSGEFALRYPCVGVFFNDAGIGKEHAGVAGVLALDAHGLASAGVDNASAEIGLGHDTWENGTVSVANRTATSRGVRPGMSVKAAAAALSKNVQPLPAAARTARPAVLFRGRVPLRDFTVNLCDSISMIDAADAGQVVISGSHGGAVSAVYALRNRPAIVFFNDAGVGKNRAGIRSLELLAKQGVAAGTVMHVSARIGDARDTLESGIVSYLNDLGRRRGLAVGMCLREMPNPGD